MSSSPGHVLLGVAGRGLWSAAAKAVVRARACLHESPQGFGYLKIFNAILDALHVEVFIIEPKKLRILHL